MEQAYRDANISFKVSNYMLLQMHNQVIIVLTNCQKQSLVQVQLPTIFLHSAALRVTSLCDFGTAMQMQAQAASASCIQRIWRQHLEHRRYQAFETASQSKGVEATKCFSQGTPAAEGDQRQHVTHVCVLLIQGASKVLSMYA